MDHFHGSGDVMQRLEVDFEVDVVTLKFKDPTMESRFENYLTLRARQYHDGMWLLRAWLVMSRAVHEVSRGSRLSVLEVYLNCVFVVFVAAAYGLSRRVSRFGEGTAHWQLLVLGLTFLHATQLTVSFTHYAEHGSRRWFRYYYLGLDYAIDATMFSLLFGLRQHWAALALAMEVSALVICLRVDAPPASSKNAGVPGIVDGLVFAVGLFACARAQEKASRAAFARDMRHDIRHSIDLRALQQPFSAGNLSAWLRAFANRSSNVQPQPSGSTSSFGSRGTESYRVGDNNRVAVAAGENASSSSAPPVSRERVVEEMDLCHSDSGIEMQRHPLDAAESGTCKSDPALGQVGGNIPLHATVMQPPPPPRETQAAAAENATPIVVGEASLVDTTTKPMDSSVTDSKHSKRSRGDHPAHNPPPTETMRRFETLQAWEIDYDRLRVVRKIGAGSAGHVYKGEYIGAVVAIKQLYSTFIDPSNLDEFSREVTLLHKLKHPHVLTFYGIARRDVYCYIVTEFCPYALDAILSGKPGNETDGFHFKQPPRLSVARRVKIAHEVSLALAYLHAERVLHHDLKPGNILLNSDFVARVSDFGLSQLVARDTDPPSSGSGWSSAYANRNAAPKKPHVLGGTATFSAPEITLGTVNPGFHALCKLDVFSFGIVLAAVFAPNGDPYYFYVAGDRDSMKAGGTARRENDIREAVARKHLRPRVPAALPAEIRPLMERCWAQNPDIRPTFTDISRDLRAYLVNTTDLENTTPTHLPVGPEAM